MHGWLKSLPNKNFASCQKYPVHQPSADDHAVESRGTNKVETPIDYPASETYDKFTPQEIKALCRIHTPENCRASMPEWETITEGCRRFYRLQAYWTLRGATDPDGAAYCQEEAEIPFDPEWHAECMANGWRKGLPWQPKTLRELEERFLPPPTPNIRLIIERCPQMAMIHALRGDVSEPYWWAALAVTEHASPNLSRECSDGYAGFSEEELDERVTRIHAEGKKPALCDRLNSVNPDVCRACKFWGSIGSPIALGFTHEPRLKKGTP